jgi:thiol-disulfide isomerase/thioredoxin
MARLAPYCALMLLALAGGCNRQADPAPQPEPAAASATAAQPLAPDTTQAGKRAPDVEVIGPDGRPAALSDLKGKPLLVNMWATWCVPCVKELPTLDTLAARDAATLQVVVVSEDLEGRKAVDGFLQRRPLKTLKTWLDPQNALMIPTKTVSLPTTILYDADGKEVWRVTRDVDWTGAQAKALLAHAG